MGEDDAIYCENCKHFKGDARNCIDELTVAISGIPWRECDGYDERRND